MKVSIVSVKFCVVTFQPIPRLNCAEAGRHSPIEQRVGGVRFRQTLTVPARFRGHYRSG